MKTHLEFNRFGNLKSPMFFGRFSFRSCFVFDVGNVSALIIITGMNLCQFVISFRIARGHHQASVFLIFVGVHTVSIPAYHKFVIIITLRFEEYNIDIIKVNIGAMFLTFLTWRL